MTSAPPAAVGGPVAREVRARLERRVAEMAALLGRLVRIESPSDDPDGLNEMAAAVEDLFGDFGPLRRHPIGPGGARHLDLTVAAGTGTRTVDDRSHLAVFGHYDTVWPKGTLARLPFEVSAAGTATGPGCFDMKGGLVLLQFALAELRDIGVPPGRPLRILFNCDEEIRSRTSRGLIEDIATGAAAALVLESPLPGGTLKTARKGTGTYRLLVDGRAAHAGVEPGKGASAIVELARQIKVLDGLTDPARGTTVNVGVVRGGTRPNVVPAQAEAEIDVRVTTKTEADRIAAAIEALRPSVPGTRLTVLADLTRPPMEPTPASRGLFARAAAIAAAMGVPLTSGATGGASDANLVAALGVPTLDGLGPEGGGAHADDEHVLVASMPYRAALLAGLLAEI